MELLSWRSIKDIAGDGGIIKTIETEGNGWQKPNDRDEALGMHPPQQALPCSSGPDRRYGESRGSDVPGEQCDHAWTALCNLPDNAITCAVKYSVRAEGGSKAILSSSEEGSVVLVGSGQPIRAFQFALKTMKQGEKASLKIKPECEQSSPCTPH